MSDKGKLLDIATSRGLPVPNGGILLHELYQFLLDEGVLVQSQGHVTVVDPNWLYEAIYEGIRFPRLHKPVAVRAAFDHQEKVAPYTSAAALPHLHVDFCQPAALTHSLCEVWSAALAQPADTRRDVLVMEMITRQSVGTAVISPAHSDDTAQIWQGTESYTLKLPKLGTWKRPSPQLPVFAQRLQQLLRGIRRTFGAEIAQIEWVDDGHICWLIQVLPAQKQ